MRVTRSFADGREAKEFMASCIVAEAQREGVLLSEIERKMLYFTETAWAPADCMKVNEAFEREYDSGEYELKIAGLIRGFCVRAREERPGELEAWNEAVRVLSVEDHYLLVMVDEANENVAGAAGGPGWVDKLKLLGIAVAVICAIFAAIVLYESLRS